MDPTTENIIESLLRWIHVIAGVLWIGLLYFFNWVNGPTMAIPWPAKSNTTLLATAAATAISAPGSRGAKRCKSRTIAITAAATPSVGRCV